MTALVAIDREGIAQLSAEAQSQAIGNFIAQGRDMLARAIEAYDAQGIGGVVRAKGVAHVIKAEVDALGKTLAVSKEARIDAEELVRRSEFALGKAIRAGQEDGQIATAAEMKSDAGRAAHVKQLDESQLPTRKPRPSDFVSDPGELNANGAGIYQIADDIEPEQFEEALSEAKAEGNMSRANVVRKIKQQTKPQTRDERADTVERMANQGHRAEQIARELGISREATNGIARDYGIEIHADKVVGRTHRIDSTRIVRETVQLIEGTLAGLALVDVASLDPREVSEWTASLDQSIRALNRFNKKIKEAVL